MEGLSSLALQGALGAAASVTLYALSPFLLLPLAILVSGRWASEIAEPVTLLAESVSVVCERLAQVFLALLTLGVLATVLLRYIFGISSNALQEGALFAHGLAFLLAAPAALGRNAHVRVDIFFARLNARGKAIVDLIAFHAFLLPMMLAILAVAGPFVGLSWRIMERSPETDGLPAWFLVKTAIPVFAVLMLAQGVAWASRAAALVRAIPPAPERFSEDRERPA